MITAADVARLASGGRVSGGFMVRCPAPYHDDKTPSCKVWDAPDGSVRFHCFAGCDWRDVRAGAEERGWLATNHRSVSNGSLSTSHKPAKERFREQTTVNRTSAAIRLWDKAVPLHCTMGYAYFAEQRSLVIDRLGDLSHALHWHAGERMIVALMRDPETGEPCGVHRTFLNPDGSKRERKMLGRQGVIHLSPDDAVTTGLGITEGVEDGLAVLLSGWSPVWAAASAGAIRKFPVLRGIEALTVFADRDRIGTEAALECAARWLQAGQEASVAPSPGGANG